MRLSYLIDTDWVIHYLNGKDGILKKFSSLRLEGMAISVISLAELYEGVYDSTDPTGDKRGRLRKKNKLIGDFDLLIASTCLYYNLTLLSNNRKHFTMVEGLNVLSLS